MYACSTKQRLKPQSSLHPCMQSIAYTHFDVGCCCYVWLWLQAQDLAGKCDAAKHACRTITELVDSRCC